MNSKDGSKGHQASISPQGNLGIDIDPYDTAGSAPELQDAAGYEGPESPKHSPPSLPTVLKKLQKWGDYAAFGEVVRPTRLIPMKTPLSSEILASWSLPEAPRHRLTVRELLDAQRALGRRVGLILDLSNHDCLYTADIPAGVAYTHIHLVAKELPPATFVSEVCDTVRAWWAQHPDDYIAVHCAYGFNRTGFVVCCYLVEHCGLSVDEALRAFADARPPGVKHEAFRNELYARYAPPGSQAHSQHQHQQHQESPAGASRHATAHAPPHTPHTSSSPGSGVQGQVQAHTQQAGASSTPAAVSMVQQMGHLAEAVERGGPDAAAAADAMLRLGSGMLMDTPQGAAIYGSTARKHENDSLGANDRAIIAGLRAHHADLLSQAAASMTPTQLSKKLGGATASPAPGAAPGLLPPSPINPKLQRKSLSDIQWTAPEPSTAPAGGASAPAAGGLECSSAQEGAAGAQLGKLRL
mmetsp:Transcript_35137/g.88962  ORF Transcript_35137/g.88962 Transcript_35137/m.88962 type:complete len:468 (-) Transcript_35137:650-2053(-)